MHESARRNAEIFIKNYVDKKHKILDVGSMDINGSIKSLVPASNSYVGLDVEHGNNVDFLVSNYKFPFDNDHFDIIMSSSCFEHCDFFWMIFLEIFRCLKSGGFIYICVPSEGFEHKYPIDAYRFKSDFGKVIEKWGLFNNYKIKTIEQYIDPTSIWKDNVIILQKKILLF